MKQLFLLLSALLITCTPLAARTTGELLARTMVANEGRVVMGASTLVSVYLYSDRPIHSYRRQPSPEPHTPQRQTLLYLGMRPIRVHPLQEGTDHASCLGRQGRVD